MTRRAHSAGVALRAGAAASRPQEELGARDHGEHDGDGEEGHGQVEERPRPGSPSSRAGPGRSSGSTSPLSPITWKVVFSFPSESAAITTFLSTESRSRVTLHSRTSTTMVTAHHHGLSKMMARPTKAIPVIALSAIGSAILPKSVTSPRLRAMSPSILSVIIATTKITNAVTRQPIESPPSTSSAAPKNGTSTIRSVVRMFGRLRLLGLAAAASGSVTAGSPPGPRRHSSPRRPAPGRRPGRRSRPGWWCRRPPDPGPPCGRRPHRR